MGETFDFRYEASRTLSDFHNDDSFMRGTMGPFGSGKSTAMVWEMLMRGFRQNVWKGRRTSKWGIIRSTYSDLRSTTIPTFSNWVSPVICPVKMEHPIKARLEMPCPLDGGKTLVDMTFLFFPLDNEKDLRRLLGIEFTGAWVNEAKEVSYSFISDLTGRMNRFPSKKDGGFNWSGIIMDTNPPDTDHWWYKMAEENTPVDWKFFKQPGGLIENEKGEWVENPLAENIQHLGTGYDYYRKMLGGKKRDWISVFVGGEYGNSSSGKPVFPEYKDAVHYAGAEIKPYRNLPLLLGFDFGVRFCACVMGQLTPKGQLIIIDEYMGEDVGIKGFAENVIRPVLLNVYGGMKIQPFGDPAGMQRAMTDEKTCFEILHSCGIPITMPSLNNTFPARREAVAFFLNKMVDGEPAFKLSDKCPVMRKGLSGNYMYERVRVSGKEFYKDQPAKNKYSHGCDSLQYLCIGTGIVPMGNMGNGGADVEIVPGNWKGFNA